MDEREPTAALRGRVSKDAAEKILRTAADLDAVGDEMIDLQELRIAAEDAGISARAFETSVAEYRKGAARTTRPRVEPVREASLLGIAGAGAVGAVSVVAAISLILGPAPADILQGAIAAGAGSISGVIAYLRSRGGRRSPSESTDGASHGSRPAEALGHLPAGSR